MINQVRCKDSQANPTKKYFYNPCNETLYYNAKGESYWNIVGYMGENGTTIYDGVDGTIYNEQWSKVLRCEQRDNSDVLIEGSYVIGYAPEVDFACNDYCRMDYPTCRSTRCGIWGMPARWAPLNTVEFAAVTRCCPTSNVLLGKYDDGDGTWYMSEETDAYDEYMERDDDLPILNAKVDGVSRAFTFCKELEAGSPCTFHKQCKSQYCFNEKCVSCYKEETAGLLFGEDPDWYFSQVRDNENLVNNEESCLSRLGIETSDNDADSYQDENGVTVSVSQAMTKAINGADFVTYVQNWRQPIRCPFQRVLNIPNDDCGVEKGEVWNAVDAPLCIRGQICDIRQYPYRCIDIPSILYDRRMSEVIPTEPTESLLTRAQEDLEDVLLPTSPFLTCVSGNVYCHPQTVSELPPTSRPCGNVYEYMYNSIAKFTIACVSMKGDAGCKRRPPSAPERSTLRRAFNIAHIVARVGHGNVPMGWFITAT